MSSAESVIALETAATDITRRLPAAHTWTRMLFSDKQFRASAENIVSILYSIDVPKLTDAQLEEVERLTKVSINVVETHLLLSFNHRDTVECQYYGELIDRLRGALDALDSGVQMNPALRPTEEQMLESLAKSLRATGALCS